jgi:hypothetical protein
MQTPILNFYLKYVYIICYKLYEFAGFADTIGVYLGQLIQISSL